MNTYINHSGGCSGADMMWENEGNKYGVKTIAYSFPNHVQSSKNPKVLTPSELDEGFKHVLIADQTLHRNVKNMHSTYVRNLLSRNWYQVYNATAVYAVGFFANATQTIVEGGTGWAVQMAIDSPRPVFFFDQLFKAWYMYKNQLQRFEQSAHIPKLAYNFAGVGTRKLDVYGEEAIREILKSNLG